MKQKSVTKPNNNLEEIRMDEEAYYRFWYDLYNVGVHACNPPSPIVVKHYTTMPEEYRIKFLLEDMEK